MVSPAPPPAASSTTWPPPIKDLMRLRLRAGRASASRRSSRKPLCEAPVLTRSIRDFDSDLTMTEALNEKHRGLKAVVIILGILIFVMFGVIVATILSRSSQMGADAPDLKTFGEIDIPIPEGVDIGRSYVEDGRLMVDATDNVRDERLIIVIDLETGEHLGTIRFTASP